jgi:DNA-binding response OmpR family regulator
MTWGRGQEKGVKMEPEGSVLLVDDNTSMLETLRDILEISGFQVDTSVDAEDAAGKFQTNNYDVAVVDVVLPRMNGVDLVRKLKPSYPNTSFVIFTAYTDSRLGCPRFDGHSEG